MRSFLVPAAAIAILALVFIGGVAISKDPVQTVSETVYRTSGGHACTSADWERQFLHGMKPGEEKCTVDMVTRPMTPQEKKEDRRRRDQRQQAEVEELKTNCVLLSHTPMSAMTPSDLKAWDFCKSIMIGY